MYYLCGYSTSTLIYRNKLSLPSLIRPIFFLRLLAPDATTPPPTVNLLETPVNMPWSADVDSLYHDGRCPHIRLTPCQYRRGWKRPIGRTCCARGAFISSRESWLLLSVCATHINILVLLSSTSFFYIPDAVCTLFLVVIQFICRS